MNRPATEPDRTAAKLRRQVKQNLEKARALEERSKNLAAVFQAGLPLSESQLAQAGQALAEAEATLKQLQEVLPGPPLGLQLDTNRQTAWLDGRPLALSPTQFDLLAYLDAEAPRVVPAAELAEHVLGYEEPEDGQTVRYHIYRIRRQMRRAAGHARPLRTRHNAGYFLNLE